MRFSASFVELKDEPKHVTRVDETDYGDVPGVGNLVIEDRLADANLDELRPGTLGRIVEQI